MLRLNRYILVLVLWLSFFFNIERLDTRSGEFLNIDSSIYVLAVIVVVIGLLLSYVVHTAAWVIYPITILAFILAKSIANRPIWGAAYTYLTLFELSAVLITATLAHTVGRLSTDFVETVRALTFSDMTGPVYPAEDAQQVIKRELQYSRRADGLLSVVVVEADTDGPRVDLHATAREIQQLLAKRYSLVALTRLLAWRIRRTDFVLYQTEEGRLVLIAPKAGKDQTTAIASRLNEHAQRYLGVTLHCGVATFPDEGVTFEELLTRAEQSLHQKEQERRGEMLAPRRDTPADEQRLVRYQQP
ncbi:MAG: hypothetical protein M5U01_35045 [Ardenticatenaceae bacterium]|nr:hypothetical protein [Ardenticatenaceae bacterium]HBY96463.1 hypothetical protein [Chloroflexota bacterium]